VAALVRAATTAAAAALRARARAFAGGRLLEKLAAAAAIGSTLAVGALAAFATKALVTAGARALAELPMIDTMSLVERLLAGAFASAFALLLLGSLTTAVSTLFISEELGALVALPIPHGALVLRQVAGTALAASAPTLVVALPAAWAAASFAPRPLLAFAALALALLAASIAATTLGAALAVAFVRVVPPRRARFLAAFLSAIGLSAALVGARAARPERLMDPLAALEILKRFGETAPDPPRGPLTHAAHAATLALKGDASGVATEARLLGVALTLALLSVGALSRAHRRAWEETRDADRPRSLAGKARPALDLRRELLRGETRTLLRDASTPAQLGTLTAVFALYLLNVRLLPGGDPAARDLLIGVQTALALFLVSALSLRFAYPAVSSDGRAALLLRSYPLPPGRHLAARYLARVVPSMLVAFVLVGASDAALRAPGRAVLSSLLVALVGGAAIPALHLGLGALLPRYDASNPVAVALGPGGLFAVGATTALSALAALASSRELATLAGTLARTALADAPLVPLWCALAALLGVGALALGARSLERREISPT
jgi:ABC-2 type transport system permease protein